MVTCPLLPTSCPLALPLPFLLFRLKESQRSAETSSRGTLGQEPRRQLREECRLPWRRFLASRFAEWFSSLEQLQMRTKLLDIVLGQRCARCQRLFCPLYCLV